MKLKDFFNQKVNKRTHQISLDAKKRKFSEHDIDIEDIMELDISKSRLKKFKDGGIY